MKNGSLLVFRRDITDNISLRKLFIYAAKVLIYMVP